MGCELHGCLSAFVEGRPIAWHCGTGHRRTEFGRALQSESVLAQDSRNSLAAIRTSKECANISELGRRVSVVLGPKLSTTNGAEGWGRLKMQKIPLSADVFNFHCFVAAIDSLFQRHVCHVRNRVR